MKLILFFIFILFNFSAYAEHNRISYEDYPNCSPKGLGGNKQTIVRIDSAESKWGRDKIKEILIINNKQKEVVLKSKIRVLFMPEMNDGVVNNKADCPSILERSFYYKKDLLFKSFSIVDFVDFFSQENFKKKKPKIDYTYPVLESFIFYDKMGKYKPGTIYSQLSPQNGNEIMRSLVISLNHYENLTLAKMCNLEMCLFGLEITKYKTKEKYMPSSTSEGKVIEDKLLIELIEAKFQQLDKSLDKPMRPLFKKNEISLFVEKIKDIDPSIRIQTNH